jgi:Protein of unknown function (DUF935)
MTKKTTTTTAPDNIIIQQLIVRSAIRGNKGIDDWRNAHRSAEAVISTGSRTMLYDLFDDVALDPHLAAVMAKRIMSITNHKLRYVANGKDVEPVQAIIRTKGFRELLTQMMKAQFWGITVCQLGIDASGNLVTDDVPRKHIRPRTGCFVVEQYGDEHSGISYREGMYYNTCVEIGKPNDLGLLLMATPFVLYKRGGWGDWSQYSEIFGMPMKVGRYDGYDTNTKNELQKTFDNAGSALSMVIPKEAMIEFVESKNTAASGNLYKDFTNACDEQISVLILGQTETTKSSKSSGYAQSQTHSGQQDQIAVDDRNWCIGYLDTEVRRVFTQLGLPMDGGEWLFEPEQKEASLKEKSEIDLSLKTAGLPISDDYFYETYNIPKPDNYDELLADIATKKEAENAAAKKEAIIQPKKQAFGTDAKLSLDDLKDFFDFATPNT